MTAATDARLNSLDRMLDDSKVGDTFATEMSAVVDALDSSATLRRAVTDPGTPEGARRALVHGLLDGKVDKAVVDLVAESATLRWAGGRTFAAALERQAVRAQLIVADRRGELEDTEDQLFRFARLVESNPELRNMLGDRAIGLGRRQELVEGLLKAAPPRQPSSSRGAPWSLVSGLSGKRSRVTSRWQRRRRIGSWQQCVSLGRSPPTNATGSTLLSATSSAARSRSRRLSTLTSWEESGLSLGTRCSKALCRSGSSKPRRLFG